MTSESRAGAAWLSAATIYLTLEAVAAHGFQPSYSYTRNFISDLGVPARSSSAWLMNTGFCLQGTLFLIGAILLRTRPLLLFCATNAIGNALVAFFHSGSPVHAVGAVLAIVGGNATILAGASLTGGWNRRASLALGAFGLVAFAAFAISLHSAAPGLWERLSVYPITAWQLLTGAWLFSRQPTLLHRPARRAERS